MSSKEAVESLIYHSCLLLDEKDFKGYLDLCDPAFHYVITAYSPEIQKEMIWLEHNKGEMQTLFTNLPRHNSDHSPITRHANVYFVDFDKAKQQASVVTALQVYKTNLDGGATELFAVGKYLDKVSLKGDSPTLMDRNVRLETRMFGFGYHIPF